MTWPHTPDCPMAGHCVYANGSANMHWSVIEVDGKPTCRVCGARCACPREDDDD